MLWKHVKKIEKTLHVLETCKESRKNFTRFDVF